MAQPCWAGTGLHTFVWTGPTWRISYSVPSSWKSFCRSMKLTLTVKKNSVPKYFRPRTVRFAIKGAIGKEIERLEATGVLEKVEFSQWATPIVPVPKKDGSFRLCSDYKVTINPELEVDQHLLIKEILLHWLGVSLSPSWTCHRPISSCCLMML